MHGQAHASFLFAELLFVDNARDRVGMGPRPCPRGGDPVAIASGLRAAVRVLAEWRPSHVERGRTSDAKFSVVAEILRRWSPDDALEGDLAAIDSYLRLPRVALKVPPYLDAV